MITATSYTDTGRADSTTYSYTLKAIDTVGNQSAASAPWSAAVDRLLTVPAFDFEDGADGAALPSPWTLRGLRQRGVRHRARQDGQQVGLDPGPGDRAYGGARRPPRAA